MAILQQVSDIIPLEELLVFAKMLVLLIASCLFVAVTAKYIFPWRALKRLMNLNIMVEHMDDSLSSFQLFQREMTAFDNRREGFRLRMPRASFGGYPSGYRQSGLHHQRVNMFYIRLGDLVKGLIWAFLGFLWDWRDAILMESRTTFQIRNDGFRHLSERYKLRIPGGFDSSSIYSFHSTDSSATLDNQTEEEEELLVMEDEYFDTSLHPFGIICQQSTNHLVKSVECGSIIAISDGVDGSCESNSSGSTVKLTTDNCTAFQSDAEHHSNSISESPSITNFEDRDSFRTFYHSDDNSRQEKVQVYENAPIYGCSSSIDVTNQSVTSPSEDSDFKCSCFQGRGGNEEPETLYPQFSRPLITLRRRERNTVWGKVKRGHTRRVKHDFPTAVLETIVETVSSPQSPTSPEADLAYAATDGGKFEYLNQESASPTPSLVNEEESTVTSDCISWEDGKDADFESKMTENADAQDNADRNLNPNDKSIEKREAHEAADYETETSTGGSRQTMDLPSYNHESEINSPSWGSTLSPLSGNNCSFLDTCKQQDRGESLGGEPPLPLAHPRSAPINHHRDNLLLNLQARPSPLEAVSQNMWASEVDKVPILDSQRIIYPNSAASEPIPHSFDRNQTSHYGSVAGSISGHGLGHHFQGVNVERRPWNCSKNQPYRDESSGFPRNGYNLGRGSEPTGAYQPLFFYHGSQCSPRNVAPKNRGTSRIVRSASVGARCDSNYYYPSGHGEARTYAICKGEGSASTGNRTLSGRSYPDFELNGSRFIQPTSRRALNEEFKQAIKMEQSSSSCLNGGGDPPTFTPAAPIGTGDQQTSSKGKQRKLFRIFARLRKHRKVSKI